MTLHWFFVVSSCFLLLVANGLLVKAIGNFEDYVWSNATNLQADDVGTGSFDPRRSVWHFDCCSPEDKTQGWGVFSAVLGWRNNATIATVTVYCLYWIGIAAVLSFGDLMNLASKTKQMRIEVVYIYAINYSEITTQIAGSRTRSGCGECIYLAPRWSLKWRSRSGPAWLDGTVEHESMGTRHDNRALAARLADFLQVAYRQYQSTLWKYHRDRLVEVG
ncbi:hypothetical protein BASA61_008708 [Batrachochytrium salamandrivorans]|nr:hypothetical protein BASA61_008708 [Batrachochytrium salamandrivorans]